MTRAAIIILCVLNFSNFSFASDAPKKAPGKFVLSPGVSSVPAGFVKKSHPPDVF